jgi:hypothetical protein
MKLSYRLRVALLLCLSWLPLSCLGQEQADQATTAVVHVRVDTAYDDSTQSLLLLDTLAQYAPVRLIPVAAGDTLDALFVREYGFGVSDLPKSYALLLRFILQKNHLSRPEDLRPGSLIIPAIPKRAWMRFGRGNPMNYVANMTVFQAATANVASASANRRPAQAAVGIAEAEPSDVAYNQSVPSEEHRFTAPYELLAFQMPLKAAGQLVESTAFRPGTVTAGTFPMPVKLASENTCDTEAVSRDHQTLTPQQKGRLSQLLKEQTQRSPVVFILDTGWPSFAAYQESRNALYEVLDKVWRGKFGVPFTKSGAQRTIPVAHHEHCRCIERALKELRALDQDVEPDKRIKVIYVPLTREQGAGTILTDLLQTTNLLQRLEAENGNLNANIIHGARTLADGLVKRYFPRKWSGEEVQTDKSVLDAVLLVGQAYAKLSDTVFFVSESWTVSHGGKYYVQYQTPEFGMVASAAGNDGTTNLLDFAQRSRSTKDTLAIINMTPDGIVSKSTRIEETDIDIALAAGFDGAVTDDITGTSFSSPRVAWFLAAGEAVRKKTLNLDRWGVELQLQLKAMRDPLATHYQKLLFNPVRYIEAQAQVQTGMPYSAP